MHVGHLTYMQHSWNYTVYRSENRFANMWTDMALKQSSTNCHNKAKMSGTIGVTKKEETHMQLCSGG